MSLDEECERLEEALTDFVAKLVGKNELEIVLSLLFKSKLKNIFLSALGKNQSIFKNAQIEFSYIDKRPIVNFPFDEHDPGIEIGDILFLFNKEFYDKRTKTYVESLKINNGIFIQAKKTNQSELRAKGRGEEKQFYLYENWPVFSLKRPREIGEFNSSKDIDFHPILKKNLPGVFMKVNTNCMPEFYLPHNLKNSLDHCGVLLMGNWNKIGRNYKLDDDFSHFTQALNEDSKKKTFVSKRIFKKRIKRHGAILGMSFFDPGYIEEFFEKNNINFISRIGILLRYLWRRGFYKDNLMFVVRINVLVGE